MCTFAFEIALENALDGQPTRLDWCEGEEEDSAMKDFRVTYHGSVNLVHALSPAAEQWVAECVSGEAQFFGGALVVEPRYTEDLRAGMLLAGLAEAY